MRWGNEKKKKQTKRGRKEDRIFKRKEKFYFLEDKRFNLHISNSCIKPRHGTEQSFLIKKIYKIKGKWEFI